MLNNSDESSTKKSPKASSITIDKKGKRKDLPVGTRAMLERARVDTVEMYRKLKKEKYEQRMLEK